MEENLLYFVSTTGVLCVVISVSKEAGSQTKKNRKTERGNPFASFADHTLTLASQRNLKKNTIICDIYRAFPVTFIAPDVLRLY